MKLFVIEIFAIALMIVAFAFIFNLYKRFYKYFSKSADSNQPETESVDETVEEEPEKTKFTPPVIVISTPDDSKKSENGNNEVRPDETESSVIKEEPTKAYSLADTEPDTFSNDITTRILPDCKASENCPDSPPIMREPKTRIYSPSNTESHDICVQPPTRIYSGKKTSDADTSPILVEPKTRIFTGTVKLSEPPTKKI